jgi:hypothetical protein
LIDPMKAVTVAVVLLAPCVLQAAEPVTNAVRWISPSNSMAAARWPWKWKSPFAIATNTPAFEAWGLKFMLGHANEMREKWQLEIPRPLTIDDIWFALYPTAQGIEGHLMTRDKRFHWAFDANVLCTFVDQQYFSPSFRYHWDEEAKLAKIKSKITKKEAEAIAREALYRLFGMTEKQLHMKKAVEINQYKFEESDGKVYPLPLFDVRWRMAGPEQYAAANIEYTPLYLEISGITKKVVKYEHPEALGATSLVPHAPIPTNYFQMLGLPDNYLDTAAEQKRRFWGLPPLTNSAAQATSLSR